MTTTLPASVSPPTIAQASPWMGVSFALAGLIVGYLFGGSPLRASPVSAQALSPPPLIAAQPAVIVPPPPTAFQGGGCGGGGGGGCGGGGGLGCGGGQIPPPPPPSV